MPKSYCIFEIQANGSDSNSGLFDPSLFNSTLSTSNGTSVTPSVTASNYTFVSSDIGNYLYIRSGTNWNPGWYRITAVNAGAATVDASIGNVFQPNHRISTVQGISTTASASSGNWSVDYTQNASASKTYTDLVITTNTITIQSTANPFTVNMIGNSIKISGGTNFNTGLYIITSLSGSNAVLDRSVGTVGATNGSGSMGGALATWNGYTTSIYGGVSIYVYIKGSSGTFNWSGTPTGVNAVSSCIGYSSIRGDNGKPLIRLSASSSAFTWSNRASYYNLIIDGQNNAATNGIINSNFFLENSILNCDFRNLTQAYNVPSGCDVHNCTFDNCVSMSNAITKVFVNCVVKNCGGAVNSFYAVYNNIFINHTGRAVYNGGYMATVSNNTFHNISSHAIDCFFGYSVQSWKFVVENNIFSNVSGNAIRFNGTGWNHLNFINNNAYFATSAFTDNYSNAADPNQPPFISRNNVALTVSPFVSAANLDFRLNNEIGGGRSCRGSSYIGAYPLTTTVTSQDIGAVQSSSNPIDRNLAPTSKSLTIKQGTTSYTEFLNLIGTGYTIGSLKAYYTRVGSSPVEISLTSQTVNGAWTSGGFVEIDINTMPGIYRFDVPNAVFSSGSSSAILQISNLNTGDKAIIIYKFQDPQNIDLTQTFSASNVAQTVGDALNAARSSGFGRWTLNDRTLSLYGADNTTIVKTFTLNSSTFPTERS
jgi:hypothetical protein